MNDTYRFGDTSHADSRAKGMRSDDARPQDESEGSSRGLDEARAKVVRLLSVRERSKAELRDRLLKDGYDPDDVDRLLEAMSAKGIVSDRRFADSFIRNKVAAGWGQAKIARELAAQGIDITQIVGFPDEFLEESEYDRALEALSRKHFTSKDPRASAYRYLVSKGFSSDICSRVVRTVEDNRRRGYDE